MALIVSRRIGDGVTITVPPSSEPQVIHVAPNRIMDNGHVVRLSFTADKSVEILRDELIEKDEKRRNSAL